MKRRLRCPIMNSRRALKTAICGRPDTGPGAGAAITGCPEPGYSRRASACYGRPGYWGFVGGVYAFHAGYWGPHIGFYGGVNYGFGYVGVGFAGGRWVGNSFAYNRAVMNVNVTMIHNTYNETVINNVSVTKVSYNGGPGGIAAATDCAGASRGSRTRIYLRRPRNTRTCKRPRAIRP